MNLTPVLAPKYFLPCVSVDSSPRSYLVKFTSDIRIPVHSAPTSGRTGCEAALLRLARPRRGTLGICGVAVLGIFSCGVAVNKISACGVAVFLNLTVCDVCVLKSAVFGETKLSAVSQFPF